jgi:hypothetical protein
MKDGFQTLEDGDWIERNDAKWIRQNLPLYEIIWQKYIGHDGNGHSLMIHGISADLEKDREAFYQAHYSAMVALIQLQEICDEYQTSLGRVKSVADYKRLLRDITLFMCFVGRVRDMMKKMDTALHLKGEIWKRFADFYQQRSNYLHSPIPAQFIDSDGLVSMAMPGGVLTSEADWLDESRWSDANHKKYVEVADFMRDSLKKLLEESHAASSQFLTTLKSAMPNFVSFPVLEMPGSPAFWDNKTPLSGVASFEVNINQNAAASGVSFRHRKIDGL